MVDVTPVFGWMVTVFVALAPWNALTVIGKVSDG